MKELNFEQMAQVEGGSCASGIIIGALGILGTIAAAIFLPAAVPGGVALIVAGGTEAAKMC